LAMNKYLHVSTRSFASEVRKSRNREPTFTAEKGRGECRGGWRIGEGTLRKEKGKGWI